jgi:hypothetical protein
VETFRNLMTAGAVILAIAGFVPYIWTIWRDRNKVDGVKPSQTSWIIWGTLTTLTAAGMHQSGTLNGQMIIYVIGDCIVVPMALIWGTRNWKPLDYACLAGAGVGLVLWAATDTPLVAILVGSGITFIGSLPTFGKTWTNPEQEPPSAWVIAASTSALQSLAIPEFTLAHATSPLTYLVIQVGICGLIFLRPKKKPITI